MSSSNIQLSLFESENAPNRKEVKKSEAKLKTEAKLYNAAERVESNLPPLNLPIRYERLHDIAEEKKIPIRPLIVPVHDAIKQIEEELHTISEILMGRLFVISGETGSGKTTFLSSLGFFIDNISIFFLKDISIDRKNTIEKELYSLNRPRKNFSVVVLEGREAPGTIKSEELDVLLTTLNRDFRGETGCNTLFVIPTTSPNVAQNISMRANSIGGMTSKERPFYVFTGPPRNEYIPIINETLRSLNDGRILDDYGIDERKANSVAQTSNSIGNFMQSCQETILSERRTLRKAMHSLKRKRIHLWMVFCSLEDDLRRNYDMIRSLTTSDYHHVQVKRLLRGNSREVRYWENNLDKFARAAQYLDLRISHLPMRTVNSVVSAYADYELQEHLKSKGLFKRAPNRDSAQDSLRATAIGTFLITRHGFFDKDLSRRGKSTLEKQDLFKEIAGLASKDDKALNICIVRALRDIFASKTNYTVHPELPITDNSSVITDVAVVNTSDIYCLEIKWRSQLIPESKIIRQTVKRVEEFSKELPEIKNLLES
ncbi:hypothetical protein QUF80_18250 [Desulfococcaceae bacterium HSG8]|nr:hypothetical protein [Desulfococcaceae bacterium HSG8]